MPPNTEPSPADVAAVGAHLSGQPAPTPEPQAQPAPAPQAQPQLQPEPVTPQPAPTQEPADPFASLFASEPAPQEPAAPAPQPEPAPAPVEPAAPQPVAQPAPTPPTQDYQTYEEYMAQATANIPAAPPQPDPEKIDPNDPVAIKGFFDDLVNTAVQRATTETARKQAIQNTERQVWDEAFKQYPSLRENKPLRDMVHNIRMGYFNRGYALRPAQAASLLLESLGHERRAGAAGAQVVTTYEQVQPNSGGSGAPVPTHLDTVNVMEAVQTGGETALAEILDKQIKAGKTW